MQENILISGKSKKTRIPTVIFGILAFVSVMFGFFWMIKFFQFDCESCDELYGVYNSGRYCLKNMSVYFIISATLIIDAILIHQTINRSEIIVTDKIISGKIAFGENVCLPVNDVSAVCIGFFKQLILKTPYGQISFWRIENRDEVHKVITQLLEDCTATVS